MRARQILAGDVELAVGAGAVRPDDRVVEAGELLGADVAADGDVAEEAVGVVAGGLLVALDDALDLRMVRGDAGADEAERRRQAVDHVDLDRHLGMAEKRLGGVEARRSRSDDRDSQGLARVTWGHRTGGDQAPTGSSRDVAAPSRASRAWPTDIETQEKIGVSRSVQELDSVVRSSCTRSRKSLGSSHSKETTNS